MQGSGQKGKSISLWSLDRKIVTELAQKEGLTFSAALRKIIRDWYAKQAQDYKRDNPNR